MLLIHENPKLVTNGDRWTCRKQNQIKMKPKTSTQDNVLQMNIKNINPSWSENLAYTVKPRKYILGL